MPLLFPGPVGLTASDVGADPAGTAAGLIALLTASTIGAEAAGVAATLVAAHEAKITEVHGTSAATHTNIFRIKTPGGTAQELSVAEEGDATSGGNLGDPKIVAIPGFFS